MHVFGTTIRAGLLLCILFQGQCLKAVIEDHSHYSVVLGSTRNYRVFLPPGYYLSCKRYPVIYWFHGSGGSSGQLTYKSEFEEYVKDHDVIIVNVDGTTPGGSSWDYGLAFEYNTRTQEGKAALTGMQFSKYIRELIGITDSLYRTIPDRDHRAVSGQSMGGLMSPWVASQNKDLIGSASLFSPSPDAAMFGPPGKEVCFVNRELYRSLKGIPLRITVATGDRYRQYYQEQRAVWELADLTHFEYHEVDYPDHRAVGIPDQFNFHLEEFSRKHPFPQRWHHADPFTNFTVWNTRVIAKREVAAFTLLEKVTPSGMLLSSRAYLPNGPVIQDEQINLRTDCLYSPSGCYYLTDFNLSTGNIHTSRLQADTLGRLMIDVGGGGHALGITGMKPKARLFILPSRNREEIYAEEGRECQVDFTLVNVGNGSSGPVSIRAFSKESSIIFIRDVLSIANIDPGSKLEIRNGFPFRLNSLSGSADSIERISAISVEATANDSLQDKTDIFVYPVRRTVYLSDTTDLLILDGNTRMAEVYDNRSHEIKIQKISGGTGNGNSIPEPGEIIELYVRLPQGLGPVDQNTFHPAYLLNAEDCKWISVAGIRYNMKGSEYSGAANLQSRILIDPNAPPGADINLWIKCESYEFREEGYNRPLQLHKFDYRKILLRIGQDAPSHGRSI